MRTPVSLPGADCTLCYGPDLIKPPYCKYCVTTATPPVSLPNSHDSTPIFTTNGNSIEKSKLQVYIPYIIAGSVFTVTLIIVAVIIIKRNRSSSRISTIS